MSTEARIVIFINAIRPATFNAIKHYVDNNGTLIIEPVVLVDEKIKNSITIRNGQTELMSKVQFISADLDSAQSIRESLAKLDKEIIAVVSQYENSIHELQKLIPYVPYLNIPSESSLTWATEKKFMRDLFGAYDRSLVPKYIEIHELDEIRIDEIDKQIGYPAVIKPSGLEGALLVSQVNNKLELIEGLEKGFAYAQNAYDKWIKRQKPFFLVEEFMDGDMYSIDVYIDSDGNCVFTPIVRVITGKKVGYNDFFGYVRKTPVTDINDENLAQEASKKACLALGLRSITAHVELMRMKDGTWKIIELGPRIGGYRHDMYMQSFGINHIMNDILNRAGHDASINTEIKGYSALYNIYAKKEGKLKDIKGLDKVRHLQSVVDIKQSLRYGEEALFARHNGDPVLDIMLFNSNLEQFNGDCETIEKELEVIVD